MRKKGENNIRCAGKIAIRPMKIMFTPLFLKVNPSQQPVSDSVKRHVPIDYVVDLTPVVAVKEARASWNAPRRAETA
jgi:hypothetical protein